MASKDFSDWRTEVDKYCQGVNTTNYQALLDAEVKEVIRDFCVGTHLWTQTLTDINIISDQNNYTLTIPDTDGKAELVGVESVMIRRTGEAETQFRQIFPLNERSETWRTTANWKYQESSDPTHFYLDNPKVLYLYPIPTVAATSGLRPKIVVKPTDDATKCPDWIYEDWKVPIAWGAAGRLLSMTTQKWFDAKLSLYFTNKYEGRRVEAMLAKQDGYTSRESRVQIPFFGGSRSSSWTSLT